MRAVIKATVLALVFITAISSPARDAAAAQPCFFGPLNHTALAGTWTADDGYEFAFNIYPCGGHSELFWMDTWGNRYRADYRSVQTLDGGGWIGRTWENGGPWYTDTIGYKPAEPGHIQLIFWAPHTYEQLHVRHARRLR